MDIAIRETKTFGLPSVKTKNRFGYETERQMRPKEFREATGFKGRHAADEYRKYKNESGENARIYISAKAEKNRMNAQVVKDLKGGGFTVTYRPRAEEVDTLTKAEKAKKEAEKAKKEAEEAAKRKLKAAGVSQEVIDAAFV